MKIAILAHSLHPIKEPYAGGLEMITHLLCRTLQEKGHKVDLYAHPDSDPTLSVKPIAAHTNVNLKGVEKYLEESCGIDAHFINEYVAYTQILNQIKQVGYDIVHNHSLHYQPIVLGNMLGIPFITTLHTPAFPLLQMGSVAIHGCDIQKFTVVSEKLGQIWSEFIEDYEVIYNGIDVSRWKYSLFNSDTYLFWYGRICEEKGLHTAIEAAIQSQTKLVFAGPISNQEYFDEYVCPLMSSEFVEYIGHQNQEEINHWLQNAKATLFTSTWEEPYGLVIAESLASGTPVIAHAIGAAPEILTSECGILVHEHTAEAYVQAIHTVHTINRTACRQRAENFCSHKIMIDQYLDLYTRMISSTNPLKRIAI